MGVDIRLPQITAASEREQLSQVKSYLYQLATQLQWALKNIDTTTTVVQTQTPRSLLPMSQPSAVDANATFGSIKSLIIKSAEIVDAYYEEINKKLESAYVASSDFGTFKQQIEQEITANSEGVEQAFTNYQTIDTKVSTLDTTVKTIDTTVQTLDTSVKTIDTTIKTIDTTVQTLDTSIKEIDTEVEVIDTTVQEIDTNLQGVTGSVGLLETNLQKVSSEVVSVDVDLQGAKADTDASLKEIANEVVQLDTNLNQAKSNLDSELKTVKDGLDSITYSLIAVSANIKSGLLYYDENEVPIYGLEIGQRNYIDGVEVFNKFARFTAGRLSFYDQNGYEVAYISDYKIYITHAEVTGTLKLGGYLVDTSNGLTFKWVGRS